MVRRGKDLPPVTTVTIFVRGHTKWYELYNTLQTNKYSRRATCLKHLEVHAGLGEKKSEVHVILDAVIGFASGCFRKWIEISGPIPKCGEIKPL